MLARGIVTFDHLPAGGENMTEIENIKREIFPSISEALL